MEYIFKYFFFKCLHFYKQFLFCWIKWDMNVKMMEPWLGKLWPSNGKRCTKIFYCDCGLSISSLSSTGFCFIDGEATLLLAKRFGIVCQSRELTILLWNILQYEIENSISSNASCLRNHLNIYYSIASWASMVSNCMVYLFLSFCCNLCVIIFEVCIL